MFFSIFFFFQAEDGIRDLVRSRGLGDVYKRQGIMFAIAELQHHGKDDLECVLVGINFFDGAHYALSLIHI